MAGDNPFAYGSASWSKLGAGSPSSFFGGYTTPDDQPTIKDFPGAWSKEESKTFGGGSGADWKQGAQFLGSYLSKLGGSDQDKYRSQAEQFGPRSLGYPMGGSGGRILDNLGVVFPQQAAPLYIPGVVDSGGKSTGQRIAGGLGGALSGAAAGAPLGPFGIAAGALIGGFGGAMG